MSPEQALSGRVRIGQRTDISSLGVTLYEYLTLSREIAGETQGDIIRQIWFDEPTSIRQLSPTVPEDLEVIVSQAIAKHPDERIQTAQDLADDLRRFENDEAIQARRHTVVQHCRCWVRRHRVLATAAVVVLAIVSVTSTAAALLVRSSLVAETQTKKEAEQAAAVALDTEAEAEAEAAKQKIESLLSLADGSRRTAFPHIMGRPDGGQTAILQRIITAGSPRPGVRRFRRPGRASR